MGPLVDGSWACYPQDGVSEASFLELQLHGWSCDNDWISGSGEIEGENQQKHRSYFDSE